MKDYQPKHMRDDQIKTPVPGRVVPDGANIAGVPAEVTQPAPNVQTGGGANPLDPETSGDYIPIPGANIAPNGAVIRNPWSDQQEIKPDNEYTDEKEDLNLLIM